MIKIILIVILMIIIILMLLTLIRLIIIIIIIIKYNDYMFQSKRMILKASLEVENNLYSCYSCFYFKWETSNYLLQKK